MSSINLEEMIQLLRNCTEYAERFKLDVMTYLEEIFIEKNVAVGYRRAVLRCSRECGALHGLFAVNHFSARHI